MKYKDRNRNIRTENILYYEKIKSSLGIDRFIIYTDYKDSSDLQYTTSCLDICVNRWIRLYDIKNHNAIL